jgi:uncharacterized protein YkuJ
MRVNKMVLEGRNLKDLTCIENGHMVESLKVDLKVGEGWVREGLPVYLVSYIDDKSIFILRFPSKSQLNHEFMLYNWYDFPLDTHIH